MTVNATKQILPRPHSDLSIFDAYGDLRHQRFEKVFRRPLGRAFVLIALGIEALIEITLAVQQRDGNHRNAKVGRGSEHIASQDPQSSTISGNSGIDGNVHRKIGHGFRVGIFSALYHKSSYQLENAQQTRPASVVASVFALNSLSHSYSIGLSDHQL